MNGDAFAYSTISIATEASKVALQVLQYLMESRRFELTTRLYQQAYGDRFAEILRNPDKYATFQISGELGASEVKERLVKAGMNEWDIMTFDENDDLLCVSAENRERFNDIIDAFKRHGADAVITEDEPVAEVIPATVKRYKVNEKGDFVEVTDNFFKDVIERRDDRGEQISASVTTGKSSPEITQFVHDHQDTYVLTPYGNMVPERCVNLNGTYDKNEVILLRDAFGNISHENGKYELGAKSREVLKEYDNTPYRAVMGGFVKKQAPRTFIPARMPGTGDYYNYITRSVVITQVGLPSRDDPSFEKVYEERTQKVLEYAADLQDDRQEFFLDLDGNFIGQNQDEPIFIADENGAYKKNGQVVSKDEFEQDDLERADDLSEAEEEESPAEEEVEEKDSEQDDQIEDNTSEKEDKKEKKTKKKKKSYEQESQYQEREYTEEPYSSESPSQEYTPEASYTETTPESSYSEASYTEPAYAETQTANTEPEYYQQEPANEYSGTYSQEENVSASYESHEEYSSQTENSYQDSYHEQESYQAGSGAEYPESQSTNSYTYEQTASQEQSAPYSEGHTDTYAAYTEESAAQQETSYQSGSASETQSASEQVAEQVRARENEATAERARAAAEAEQAAQIFKGTESGYESEYKSAESQSGASEQYTNSEPYASRAGASEAAYTPSEPSYQSGHGYSDSYEAGGASHSGPSYPTSLPAQDQQYQAGNAFGGGGYSETAPQNTGSGYSGESHGSDYAEAIRAASAPVYQTAPEVQSRPYTENVGTGSAPSRSQTYKEPEPAKSAPIPFGTKPVPEPPAKSERYSPKEYGFNYNKQSVQTQGETPHGVVRTTVSKNLAAMHEASGANQMPQVGRDTAIQTNFLNQRKIFGADEIRVAGASQKQGIRSAVNLTGLKRSTAQMFTGLATTAGREDPRTSETLQAMHAASMAYQFMQLRNGATASTLRNLNMQKMTAAYRSGQLNSINGFMKGNGFSGFNDKLFTGKIKGAKKIYDKSSGDFIKALSKNKFIRQGYGGYAFVSDKSLNSAVYAIFGSGQTSAQFAQNKKFLKGFVERENSKMQFKASVGKSRRALLKHVVGMIENSDPAAKELHKGYHMAETGVRTYQILKQAVAADARWTYSKFGIRGRFDRHEAAYNKLRMRSMKGSGMSSQAFDKQVALFKEKSKAELRQMNKRQAQEYNRLRKANKQQQWLNSKRDKLHARERANEAFKKNLKNINDFPKNTVKRGGRKVANWAGNTRPGKAVRGVGSTLSRKSSALLTKVGNTKVGKFAKGVKKFFKGANELGAKIRQLFQKLLNQIIGHIITFLLAYVGTIIFIGIFTVVVLMPLSMNFSMFVNNWKTMVDEASSVESIAGTVYSELRYMEIEWASETRAYGTQSKTIEINNDTLRYTDQKLTAEEYLNSEAGTNDLLGAYAKETDGDQKNGVQGPTPFEGAKLDDYKVIKSVDGGNVFEIEGKPQEGWTSNSKEVIAMATVFYSQCVDEVATETSESVSAWNDFWNNAKDLFHRIGQWFDVVDFPILGWIAGGTDWSYTGLYRNYAYPLALNSHLEDFYLSTYIYPTKWTAPELSEGSDDETNEDSDAGNNVSSATHEKSEGHEDSRYDTDQETKTANAGDATLNAQWGASKDVESKHGTLGIGKNGGSGKVDSKNQVSKSLWGELGDDSYQGFETCEDTSGDNNPYNGYGCMLRYQFSYKWSGAFGTDEDGSILDEAAVESSGFNKLHYGEADSWNEPNEGDGEGEDENNNNVEYNKTGQDVSADVSPYYEDADVGRGYQRDNCLVYPLKLSAVAWNCWEETGQTTISLENGGGYYPTWALWQKKFDYNHGHFTHGQSFVDGDGEWAIDKIETTSEGFDVYSFRIPRDSETGEILRDEPTDATVFHLKHNCNGQHQGIYCGGHAQLRTRGVVYGLSKEQVTDQVLDDNEKSLYNPKFIDSDEAAKDKETELYGDALTVRNEPITTFNVDDLPDATSSQILDEDTEYVKDARDLYDIDILITRPKDMYPQFTGMSQKTVIKQASEVYLSVLFPGLAVAGKVWDALSGAPTATQASETSTGTEPWKSWTLTNMGHVTELINQNWHDAYQVVDTQTIVGGQDGVNSLDDDMMNNVLSQLGWDNIQNGIDIGSSGAIENLKKIRENTGPAVVNGKELSIAEEMELVNQLRHLKYAMSLVGKVSYSQDAHSYLWGNLSGHQTDCSGFVSNVWRDVLGLTGDSGAMTTSSLKDYAGSALKPYTGAGTNDIEPGDIILKNPDDIGGSAHALIYVGEIDSSKLYLDRTATDDSSGQTEYKFYNEGGSLKYGGEGSTEVYAIDCSSMTITTVAYEDNAPNTLKEFFSSGSLAEGFKNLLGLNNFEPNGGVQKVRSGNVRFSAKSYLNDNSAGYDLYYIDMDQLAKNKGVYTFNSDGSIYSSYGTFFDDYSNFQSKTKEISHSSQNSKLTDSTGNIVSNATSYNKFAESSFDFWEQDTAIDAERDRRKTVYISTDSGKKAEAAKEMEVEDPPVPSDIDKEDSSDYDDFDWQAYADQLPEGEFKDQLKELIDYYGESQWAKYYASGLIQIKQTSDGQLVFYEEQASKWNGQTIAYGTAVAGSDGTNTVARRGCFLYALAAAVSAKTGKIYTLQDVIKECGGKLTWDNGTLSMSGLGTVGGDGNKLNNVLSDAGLDGSYHGKTKVSLSAIDKGLQEGKVYCVWSTSASDPNAVLHSASGAGMHWTTIIGRTSSGNYIVACNGGRGMEISPSQMPKYFESYAEIG